MILILCIAVICMVSLWQGFERQADWSMEKYGTTSDDSIPINDETEVKIRFQITEDNFQGITVRLTSDTRNFESEKLEFTMVDGDTEEQIAAYEMELKNEVYNSATLALLPYEHSKGKEVIVYITGKEIHKIPYLNISKNSNLKSELYIDGKKQKEVLVFSGAYIEGKSYNYQAFIEGALLLCLLVLVYNWNRISVDIEVSDEIKEYFPKNHRVKRLWNRILFFLRRYNKVCRFILLTIVYISLVVFVYQCYIDEKLSNREDVTVVSNIKNIDDLILNEKNGEVIQIFTGRHSNLSVLYYPVEIKNTDKNAMLHVIISDEENGYLYHDAYISIEKIKNNELKILLQKEFTSSYRQKVRVEMEPIDFGSTEIQFQSGLGRSSVECFVNGEKTDIAPVLTASYNNNDFLNILYAVYALVIYVFLALIYYLFAVKEVALEKAFIPVVLLLGIIYLFVIPLYIVPDEYTHIDTAYSISNQILGVQESEKAGYMYKRECDLETEMAMESRAKMSSYRKIYTMLFSKTQNDTLVECYSKSAMGNASEIFYFPAAVGITIGRLLKWGNFPTLMFGRFCNLFVYVLLAYLAIRKTTFGRGHFFVVASLPITLQEAASYAYDSIINGMALVMLSYIFYMMKKDSKISRMDVFVLLFTVMQFAYVKGGVYLPLCFLIVLIPYERNWKIRGKMKYFVSIIILTLTSFLKKNIISIIKRFQTTQGTNINGFTGGDMYTFGYLLHHPLKLISLYVNTIFMKSDSYVQGVFGGELAGFQLYMPWITVVITFVVLVFLSIDKNTQTIVHRKFSKLWIGLIFLGSVMLILLSMLVAFTTTDYNYIAGVQGRYFVPIVLLPFFLFANRKAGKIEGNANKYINIYCMNHIIILLYILMVVFK